VTGVAFSPAGGLFASVGADRSLRVYTQAGLYESDPKYVMV